MKKTIILAIAALAVAVASCGGNKNSGSGVADSIVDSAETQTDVKLPVDPATGNLRSAEGLPLIADFSAEWCPPCRQMKPVFAALKKEYEGKVEMVTVDVDTYPELADKYGVQSIPTLVFISKEGKEVYRTVGLRSAADVKSDITEYLK